MYSMTQAAAQYKRINNESGIDQASPHRLIQMLMSGALDRLVQAKSAMERGEVETKGVLLGKATGIIAGLQGSLERDRAPDLVDNLERLYDYMQRRLFEANVSNDPALVQEVTELMRTVKTGWDEIDPASQAAS
ncbi:flagellar export chaperone FliS [Pseudohongiella sp.]|uniref:Flagellar secretion chaperone FliS n=1 Tax=marine sediment metagenome TaxID=412755 RepID=A0A0F9YH84_9ZZZZ|nr:flagellar export chaperone FliS [Pseudohongiella sp.]HDZ09140.1 flagellar export chaperone FliS [Pseudohongiella sp.]HEA63524.1 flagellar export chaperone FliS [Pseudohongiella sp.]